MYDGRGLWLRGATAALVCMILVAVPARADAPAAVNGASATDAPLVADTTTLALRPVCDRGDLQRFAVANEVGPATVFTVAVAGVEADRDVPIAAGETVFFWVDTAADAAVEITWPDGSAAAVPAGDPCTADTAPDDQPAAVGAPEEPALPQPDTTDDRDGQQRAPDEPAPAPVPDTAGASDHATTDGSDVHAAADDPPPAAADVQREPPGEQPSIAVPEGQDAADARIPRPRPSGSAFACPGGWVAVDVDGDNAIDAADGCERILETGAVGEARRDAFTLAALLVTVVLLVASLGVGAVRRGDIAPPRR